MCAVFQGRIAYLMSFKSITPWWFAALSAADSSAVLVQDDVGPAGNEQVAEIMRNRPGRGAMNDGSDPTPTEVAVKAFEVREGFEIELVASEPEIGQPFYSNFDRRGRMWVVQYLQYQFPAGLKITRYDNHLRAQFDKVPPPPPNHFPGTDKITVFEDTDGDGDYDSSKDVITDLSITSSVAAGGGGIWVL